MSPPQAACGFPIDMDEVEAARPLRREARSESAHRCGQRSTLLL